jgi:hypothetical protein
MESKSNTPLLTWLPAGEAGCLGPQLDLRLGGYTLSGASVAHSREGGTFACTIGPMSDEAMAALDGAANNGGRVCLLFPQPLLLDLIALERKESQCVRIVGRIVDPVTESN